MLQDSVSILSAVQKLELEADLIERGAAGMMQLAQSSNEVGREEEAEMLRSAARWARVEALQRRAQAYATLVTLAR